MNEDGTTPQKFVEYSSKLTVAAKEGYYYTAMAIAKKCAECVMFLELEVGASYTRYLKKRDKEVIQK